MHVHVLHFHESVQLERDWKTARCWEYLHPTMCMGRNTKVGKSLVSIYTHTQKLFICQTTLF